MSLSSELTAREQIRRYAFDLPISTVLLPLLFIPFLILFAFICIDSPGSPIYRQLRVGRGGKKFWIYKMRTMFVGSNQEQVVLNQKTDKRITRVGHILRRFRVDELLQLINVWMGDMSLFGTRPDSAAVHEEYVQLTPGYVKRLQRLPGMFGYAQLFGCECDLPGKHETKLMLDLYYLQHQSILLDGWIVIKTIPVIATGRKLSITEHPWWQHQPPLAPAHAHAAE